MAGRRRNGTAVVVDEARDRDVNEIGTITISVVSDLTRLLDARSTRLHGDVIDAVVDLAVDLLDEETRHGQGQND